jgi:hypothetical protein
MCLDEESGGGKEEQEQLDGMKFLGERDMKSLHKVIIEYLQCAIIDHKVPERLSIIHEVSTSSDR